ncbi:hypothetical protein H105_04656 [Trichophyton soudanense CBS 452.61]|uniref:Uncharacterized protein n=1 Tax=Trichophyton soudanense CBS 452.61 TaxID=1215331 RepID=A0A022XTM8_TRISD|nr:hypothetical protein H105_04656 [Trichophyton soudanense CBS 452.61]
MLMPEKKEKKTKKKNKRDSVSLTLTPYLLTCFPLSRRVLYDERMEEVSRFPGNQMKLLLSQVDTHAAQPRSASRPRVKVSQLRSVFLCLHLYPLRPPFSLLFLLLPFSFSHVILGRCLIVGGRWECSGRLWLLRNSFYLSNRIKTA